MNVMSLGIHGAMLADHARNSSLAAGVESLVRPGDVVVDVGTGSAFLAMLAARAGARKVYAIEMGSMAKVAKRLVELNGYAEIVTVVSGLSHDYMPPEPADIILCETLGIFALDETFRTTLVDARDRMMRKNGKLLPESVRVITAPVTRPSNLVDICQLASIHGLNFTPLSGVFQRIYRRCYLESHEEVASPQVTIELDCYRMNCESELDTTVEFVINRSAEIAGFGLWFEADLAQGVKMNSRSSDPGNHWGQVFLPLTSPILANEGDCVRLNLTIDDRQRSFSATWCAEQLCSRAKVHVRLESA